MDGRGQLQALAVLVPVKDPQVSTEYELIWPFWRRKISFITYGNGRRIP